MAGGAVQLREVWITDAGVVTAAGNNLEETWYGILSGKTAIREINRFPVKAYRSGIGASIPDIKPSGAGSLIHAIIDILIIPIRRPPIPCLSQLPRRQVLTTWKK